MTSLPIRLAALPLLGAKNRIPHFDEINERLHKATGWEIVAVPDIRVQTWSVARRLSNAHWVEGEGL